MLDIVRNFPSSKHFLLGVVLAIAMSAAFRHPLSAAGPDGSDAEKRAVLYLVEARKIFRHDQWAIVREGTGGFTAVHSAASGGVTSSENASDKAPPLIVHVSITFRPLSVGSTDCTVKIEGFRYTPQGPGKRPKIAGPFKADYPENTKYITDVLTRAEDRVGKKYPKYQAN